MKILLLILVVAIYSCNSNRTPGVSTDSIITIHDSIKTKVDTIDTEINDSVINVKFPADSISTTVTGNMKGINHPVTVLIPIKQGKELRALLVSEDPIANIRINQIFTPDGKADGPFGKELKRAVTQQGTYKLIIAENKMQGDEWKGSFKLTITVK